MGLDRGWLGVALVAMLGILGCGGANPIVTDGGRDAAIDTPSDTAEAPVDTASGTAGDVGDETVPHDIDAGTDGAMQIDASPRADAPSEPPATDVGPQDAGGEGSSPADVAADSFDNRSFDASATGGDAPDACVSDQNETRFVDHVFGTDDQAHGNGPGTCAFRTLAYALGQAAGQISLSPQDTYQGGVAGEIFPFQLTGSQNLACNGATLVTDLDDIDHLDDGTVTFAGTRNSVTGCHFDGGEGGKYCIAVNASATDATRPHAITASTFTRCRGTAINVPDGVNGLMISRNTFTLNGSPMYFEGSHTNVSVVDNNFLANLEDVICDDAEPGISGSGNIRGGGAIVCLSCEGCPFGP